jgi:hypothetical protein
LAILDAHDSLMEGDSDGTCCMLSTIILRVVLLSLIMYCPPKKYFLCVVTVRINRFPSRQRVLKQRDTPPVFYMNQRWTVSTIIRFNGGWQWSDDFTDRSKMVEVKTIFCFCRTCTE